MQEIPYNPKELSKNGQYRLNVGAIIEKNGLFFCGTRKDNKQTQFTDTLQFPQGGIDDGEDVYEAVLREIYEETGIRKEKLIYKNHLSEWVYYDIPENFTHFLGKKKGQVQLWFHFNFTGNDADINLNLHEPEFVNFYWKKFDEIVDKTIFFKKDVYRTVYNKLLK